MKEDILRAQSAEAKTRRNDEYYKPRDDRIPYSRIYGGDTDTKLLSFLCQDIFHICGQPADVPQVQIAADVFDKTVCSDVIEMLGCTDL